MGSSFLRLLLFLTLVAGACSTPSKTSGSSGAFATTDSITNKYWKLVELNGQPVTMPTGAQREPHFILHPADRRVSGSGGCNTFTGTYALSTGDRVRFSPLASTKMACLDPAASETETRFLQVLGQADSYYLRGDSLQLNRARMAPLARFVAVYLR